MVKRSLPLETSVSPLGETHEDRALWRFPFSAASMRRLGKPSMLSALPLPQTPDPVPLCGKGTKSVVSLSNSLCVVNANRCGLFLACGTERPRVFGKILPHRTGRRLARPPIRRACPAPHDHARSLCSLRCPAHGSLRSHVRSSYALSRSRSFALIPTLLRL